MNRTPTSTPRTPPKPRRATSFAGRGAGSRSLTSSGGATGGFGAGRASEHDVPLGLRERKKARLRDQIVETTATLIRERGYEATTVDSIVRAVEVSQPTFYNYFSSKDAVLRAVAHRILEAWSQGVEAAVQMPASTEKKLRRLYRAQAKWMAADKALWRAIVLSDAMNVYRTPETEVEPHLAVQKYLRSILVEGQNRGEIARDQSVSRLVENLIAMQIMACAAWGVERLGRRSLARTLDENLDFFLRGASP